MACDEAPAATIGGVNGIGNMTALNRLGLPAGIDIRSGPTSLVAAEIHLGRRASGHLRRLAALQHSSCVPSRRLKKITANQ
jgi:hypothetical protein